MENLNIISFNNLFKDKKPLQNQETILKRNRCSDRDMVMIDNCLIKNPFNTILLFTHGECSLKIGLNNYVLKSNDLVIIPEQVVNYSAHLIENCAYCIHFKTEYLLPFLNINRMEDIFPFALSDTKHVVSLTPDQSKIVKVLFEEINSEYHSLSNDKDAIIRCYLEILLLKSKGYFHANSPTVHLTVNRSFALTSQFRILAGKNFLTIRSVKEYANILHISPKHLEKIVKETLGITPKKLIHDIILLEAKVLLRQTEKTVSEIAHDLKFEDQSYFSRFFKKHTLLTPHDYRTLV